MLVFISILLLLFLRLSLSVFQRLLVRLTVLFNLNESHALNKNSGRQKQIYSIHVHTHTHTNIGDAYKSTAAEAKQSQFQNPECLYLLCAQVQYVYKFCCRRFNAYFVFVFSSAVFFVVWKNEVRQTVTLN